MACDRGDVEGSGQRTVRALARFVTDAAGDVVHELAPAATRGGVAGRVANTLTHQCEVAVDDGLISCDEAASNRRLRDARPTVGFRWSTATSSPPDCCS